ncbi:MAG: metallophosphoesterase [Coriobacteriia bacterium]|nr:metallophosphoesterase [Coriobacteriia bacterium]
MALRSLRTAIRKARKAHAADQRRIAAQAAQPDAITALNPGLQDLLDHSRRRLNTWAGDYRGRPVPLTLLHFSDIHGDQENLERIEAFRRTWARHLDDTLCTGDLCYQNFADGLDFWRVTDGTILTCVGNHDAIDPSEYPRPYPGYQPDWQHLVDSRDVAAALMDPFAPKWGPNARHQPGTTFYYKDYPEQRIRLVVIDHTLHEERAVQEQADWLSATLKDAGEKELAVVAATHAACLENEPVECTFTSTTRLQVANESYYTRSIYLERVQEFMDAGGHFTCWLCGHEHVDFILRSTRFPHQLFVVVPSAWPNPRWADGARKRGHKSQDCFNLTTIDTSAHVVKIVRVGADRDCLLRHKGVLVLDYQTGQVIHNE